MTELSHLNENARAAVALPDKERFHYIQNPRWIGYTRAQQILQMLEDLLDHPRTHRMPNLLIVGRTNNGKTMVLKRFLNRHEPHDSPTTGRVVIPVLSLQLPPVPDETRLYNAILTSLFAPFKEKDHVSRKERQVIDLLRRLEVKMLVLDELNNLTASHLDKQRQFLNVLKYLGNELQIPIVAAGTKDSFRVLQTDPQLSNRFEPVPLPKWEISEEYLKLLASFERMLPLRQPSTLYETGMAAKILAMSEGSIGEVARLLGKAAIFAIQKKVERIDRKVLDSLNWVPPSERRRKADSII